MRKLFLMLLFIACSRSFAQRLNERGEKIVSSVCVDRYNVRGEVEEHADIYFTYDESMQLVKAVRVITLYGDTYKDVLNKGMSGNINRVSYFNGKKFFDYQYEYKTNEKGLIQSKVLKCDVEVLIFNYEYDCDRLVQVSRKRRYEADGEWFDSRDIDYMCFDYIDNNCYWDKMWSATNVRGERVYYNTDMHYDNCSYGDIINDTNINPNLFVYMSCWYICLDVHEFELATEWCGFKSRNIVNYTKGFNIIVSKDNKGNIVELLKKRIGTNNAACYTVKLSYLY